MVAGGAVTSARTHWAPAAAFSPGSGYHCESVAGISARAAGAAPSPAATSATARRDTARRLRMAAA